MRGLATHDTIQDFSHRVDSDAARRELFRQCHGHTDDTCLGRSIVRLSNIPNTADDGGYIDNSTSSLLEHDLRRRLQRNDVFERSTPETCFYTLD